MHPILVVDSAEAAAELLEKRGHLYSDRLQLLMPKLLAWDFSMALLPYGPDWRAHRKLFHQYFDPSVISAYEKVTQQEVAACLLRWLDSPQNVVGHIRQLFASLIFQIVYGRKVNSLDDEFVKLVEKSLEGANKSAAPGANLVELLPFLRHIPGWLPGGTAQSLAQEYRPAVESMVKSPLAAVRKAMEAGIAQPCVASAIITDMQDTAGSTTLPSDQERLLTNVTGVAYIGASDTTVSAVTSFLLAMALYPEVQKKAQDELDRTVGTGRLPDHRDVEAMPYVQAVALETLRWLPAGPLAIPRRLTEDDEYRGHFIPAGTIVIPNAWAMLHDPTDYPEPHVFMPERFLKDGKLNPDVRDPNAFAFGYGRRVCPGAALGNAMIGLVIACTLHVFDISAGVDQDGNLKQLSTETTDGFIIHPRTVPTGLKPRSAAAERLIRDQAAFA
ncbi:hypothetical protein EIP91_005268 [Steccherinum ochraceum]|uniref:Cytochrome P450 n=1 Tax=Steccherinum ochraceum TaxID=92696 RepID=A0A4V2MXG7_9APHY|nr:hypothetical protein EIP91_005268 [Steccherinum ochraceum]